MSSIHRILSMILFVIAAMAITKIHQKIKPLPVPEFQTNKYWGHGDGVNHKDKEEIVAQEVFYTKEKVNQLRVKLNETLTFVEPLENTRYEYGMNIDDLQKIIQYWRDDYLLRFDERLKFLNSIPHFVTEIQGLQLHFLRAMPPQSEEPRKQVIPVLLLHGWPGSVREFYSMANLLTQENDRSPVAFEVIVPSLPGFGWSEHAKKVGFGALEMSIMLRNLMLRLGHNKFYIHGGDWGAIVGSHMATLYPENVIGFHCTMCFVATPLSFFKLFVASFAPSYFIDEQFESFLYPMRKKFELILMETGFVHLQATKPDTIGAALTNNPIGLAAYIMEKFSAFLNTIERDALLDNLTIYALTNSITTSARLYAESYSTREQSLEMSRVQTNVPTACTRFRLDVAHSLDWQLKDKYTNLIHSKFYNQSGHFVALEEPELLYNDFIEFVRKTV